MSTPTFPYALKDPVDFYPMRGEPLASAPDVKPVKGRIVYIAPNGHVNVYVLENWGKSDYTVNNVPMIASGDAAPNEYGFFAVPTGGTYTAYVAPVAPAAPAAPAQPITNDDGTSDQGVGTTPGPEGD